MGVALWAVLYQRKGSTKFNNTPKMSVSQKFTVCPKKKEKVKPMGSAPAFPGSTRRGCTILDLGYNPGGRLRGRPVYSKPLLA